MRRAILIGLGGLTFFAAAGRAQESASADRPKARPEGPQLGENFTVARPGMAMIWIAPGTFIMSGTHPSGDDMEVTLTRGYWLGQTEVTQAQWQAVIEHVPVPSFFKGSERPVERVAWDTAMVFCQRLTERERAGGRLAAGYVYTLPTEAQWEYACRAGTTGSYAGEIETMAWHRGNSGGQTQRVAQKQPNAWGLHDMHGNVMEWCADWYGGYAGGRVEDPAGAAVGQFRVVRGGTWASEVGLCRSALRNWGTPANATSNIGFRVALAPEVRAPAAVKDAASPGQP